MSKSLFIAEKPSVAQEFAQGAEGKSPEKTGIWNRKIPL